MLEMVLHERLVFEYLPVDAIVLKIATSSAGNADSSRGP